jgi:hypothetical protein
MVSIDALIYDNSMFEYILRDVQERNIPHRVEVVFREKGETSRSLTIYGRYNSDCVEDFEYNKQFLYYLEDTYNIEFHPKGNWALYKDRWMDISIHGLAPRSRTCINLKLCKKSDIEAARAAGLLKAKGES